MAPCKPAKTSLLAGWPLIVGLAAFIRALAQPMAPLNDPDTYLHIAAGRWMLAHAALPVHDPFWHSLAGATWVPHEIAGRAVPAAVYDLAGWSGLALLTAAAFATGLAFLTRSLLRWAEPFSTLIAVILGAVLVQGHLLAPPHLLALPILMLWSGALFAARDTGSGPPFRLLPVMALWANLQGSCIDGRAELYGYRFLSGYLAAERGDEPALTGLLARYGITWTLLMPQQGAVSRLDGLPGWRRVYTDAEAVIHMRLAARSG